MDLGENPGNVYGPLLLFTLSGHIIPLTHFL